MDASKHRTKIMYTLDGVYPPNQLYQKKNHTSSHYPRKKAS